MTKGPKHAASTPPSDGAPSPSAGREPERDGATETAEAVSELGLNPDYLPTIPVVGIGASAGGLEAIIALVRRLAYDSMACVIVQHMAPGQEGSLREILAKVSPVDVVIVKDGMPLETRKIYLAPSGSDIGLVRGVFCLTPLDTSHPRLGIDKFFRSLAHDQKTASIAVILSGAGSDGTLGLQAVKYEGGITFVQDPTTADHASMPLSALDSGYADFCLTPEEIGDELMRLASHPYLARAERARALNQDSLSKIFGPLRDVFGVDFATYKQSSIERRIERRMALHKVETLEDYVKFLEASSNEHNLLFHDLLIGVTNFFRDREPFEALKSAVFPRIFEKRDPALPIRIWVPGCSTGEEAYSIAMCLIEYLGDEATKHRVQIFGTDIDEKALERARLGTYPENIAVDVSASRLQRFFRRAEKGYQLTRQIREMVVFARHNLAKDPPFSRLDLISCRNVLIYLQSQIQKKIVRIFHYGLKPGGFLLLGSSESVADSDLYELVDRRLKLYAKRNVPAKAAFDVVFGNSPAAADAKTRPRSERTTMSVQQLADRKVIEKYGPPGVVISENFEVIQFRGRMGSFLEPASGNATLNVLKLTRPEFLVELRSTVRRALAEGVPVISDPVRMRTADGSTTTVQLNVFPLFDAAATSKSLLILFDEMRAAVPEADGVVPAGNHADPRVIEVERELAATKEYLQTTIEELETTNEELTSANEELQSSNEELQSTNEELSTSKEELQSTNEELSTVNDELHHRLNELSVSNDDLQNLMVSTSVVAVLVGSDHRIRRFSAAAERLLHLIPADIGRPVSYLAGSIQVADLEAVITESLKSVLPRTRRVRTQDGFEHDMLTVPYKTADLAIRGVLLEFRRTEAPRALGEIRGWAEALFDVLPRPVVVLDESLRFAFANKAFLTTFRLDRGIYGRPISTIWEGSMEPEARRFLEDAVAHRGSVRELEIARPLGRAALGPTRWTVNELSPSDDRPPLLVVLFEEPRR